MRHHRGMTDSNTPREDRPLRSDEDLRELIERLLERAGRRQVWLLFIDERGCLAEPLIPMEGYPDDPHALTRTDDLGETTEAGLLMQRAELLREVTANDTIVLVWERIGSSVVGFDDREWARAMRGAAAELNIPLRAQLVLHNRGVRLLQLDDIL